MLIITSQFYQPKIKCKNGLHAFTKIKNADIWKQEKFFSVNSFQKLLIFHICVFSEKASVFHWSIPYGNHSGEILARNNLVEDSNGAFELYSFLLSRIGACSPLMNVYQQLRKVVQAKIFKRKYLKLLRFVAGSIRFGGLFGIQSTN